MEKDLARHLIRTAFRTTHELQDTLSLLKQHIGASEYRECASGIAAAIDAINVALINKALATYPDLEGEIETSLARYDRFI